MLSPLVVVLMPMVVIVPPLPVVLLVAVSVPLLAVVLVPLVAVLLPLFSTKIAPPHLLAALSMKSMRVRSTLEFNTYSPPPLLSSPSFTTR